MERSKTITKKEMLDTHKLLATPIFKKEIAKKEREEKFNSNLENIFIKKKPNNIMPRTKDSTNESNYHFLVYYKEDPNSDEEARKKYYKTTNDISEDFGISRSTIYNYYTKVIDPSKKRNKSIQRIEKLSTPLPIYKKILVSFD